LISGICDRKNVDSEKDEDQNILREFFRELLYEYNRATVIKRMRFYVVPSHLVRYEEEFPNIPDM